MTPDPHDNPPTTAARRTGRSRLVPLAVLVLASALLGGCIIETPGPGPHHGWWWYHHDRD